MTSLQVTSYSCVPILNVLNATFVLPWIISVASVLEMGAFFLCLTIGMKY